MDSLLFLLLFSVDHETTQRCPHPIWGKSFNFRKVLNLQGAYENSIKVIIYLCFTWFH
jgi:hypothetical protein